MPYRYETPVNPFVGSIADLLARRGDVEAQRALSIAQAQAQAKIASGQAWGNAAQQIGQTVGAIPGQIAQNKRQALQDEGARIDIENAKAAQAASAKATQDKSIVGSAMGMASTGRNPEAIKQQLAQLGRGDLITIFDKTWTDLESSRASLKKTKSELGALEADYFGALAAGIKQAKFDPMAVSWALEEADADGHDTAQIRALLKENPDAIPQLADQLIQASPTQRKFLGEESDRTLRQTAEARALQAAKDAAADRTSDNARQVAQANETARHNQAVERISALTAGRANAAAEETARHNRATEENARNTKIGRPIIAGDAEDIAAIDEGIKLSKGLVFKQGDTGILPSIGGAMPDAVTNLTGFGVGAKQRQGVINLVKQIIGKGLEGGVLRKEDESKYEKILPTLSDHPRVVASKVNNLLKTLEQKRSIRLDALEDAGYNVSRFRERGAIGASGPQVGDVVTVRGQQVRVTKTNTDGTYEGVPVP